MTRDNAQSRPSTEPHTEVGRQGRGDFFGFVRYCHIFSAAVREVLESRLLQEVSSLPLTLPQFYLLKLMSTNGHHQVGQVAGFLGVSPPAATKNVDKLERLRLVVRTPSKGDRRATLLSVSPRGRRLVQKYEELKAARLGPVLDEFHPEEVEQLSQLLARFSVSLLKTTETEDSFCLRCAAYIDDGCPIGEIRGGCPHHRTRRARSAKGAEKRV